jgi:hypothetical protein
MNCHEREYVLIFEGKSKPFWQLSKIEHSTRPKVFSGIRATEQVSGVTKTKAHRAIFVVVFFKDSEWSVVFWIATLTYRWIAFLK